MQLISLLSSTVLCELFNDEREYTIKFLEDPHYSPKRLLLDYPRGAYTTARTFEQKSIFDFEGHLSRLGNLSTVNSFYIGIGFKI